MWTKEQTCPGPRLCNAFDRCQTELAELPREGSQLIDSSELAAWVSAWCTGVHYDDEGFYHCSDCKRIRRNQLITCPSCGRLFKGPKPNFPVNYHCEECE